MIKIFLENTSTFDFAFLSKSAVPIGKSFSVDMIIEGETNESGMLIDFSDAKKLLRSYLCDFDHKLLTTQTHVKHRSEQYVIVSSQIDNMIHSETHLDSINNFNNFFALRAKSDWIAIVPDQVIDQFYVDDFVFFERYLENQILPLMPKNIKNVSLRLNKHNTSSVVGESFDYTHTICNHSGHCQRFHGHSSQLAILHKSRIIPELTTHMRKNLNGFYIVSKKHICPIEESKQAQIMISALSIEDCMQNLKEHLYAVQYHGTEGDVCILISKKMSVLLNDESTIENITKYIYDKSIINLEQFINLPYNEKNSSNQESIKVCVYEGLTKGAMIG